MKNNILKIFLLSFTLILSACHPINEEVIESKEPFTVHIFYSQTCPRCKLLRENYVERLEVDFGDQVSFIEYDIDLYESQERYYEYIGVYDFENENWSQDGLLQIDDPSILCDSDGNYCNETWIPFVIVGDMYGFMGYNNDYLEDYVKDVHLALQNKSLSNGYIKTGRWEFKK